MNAPTLSLVASAEVSKAVAPVPAELDYRDWWKGAYQDGSVLLRSQPATAVYVNQYDAVVIRQEAEDGPDYDPCISFSLSSCRSSSSAFRKSNAC